MSLMVLAPGKSALRHVGKVYGEDGDNDEQEAGCLSGTCRPGMVVWLQDGVGLDAWGLDVWEPEAWEPEACLGVGFDWEMLLSERSHSSAVGRCCVMD